MSKEEFIKMCVSSGYGTTKNAKRYTEENPKDEYTTDDFVEVFHMRRNFIGSRRLGLRNIENGKTTAFLNA